LALEIREKYEIACLETDRPAFYERLGWELWRGPLAGRNNKGELVTSPEQEGIMILRLSKSTEIDLDQQLPRALAGKVS